MLLMPLLLLCLINVCTIRCCLCRWSFASHAASADASDADIATAPVVACWASASAVAAAIPPWALVFSSDADAPTLVATYTATGLAFLVHRCILPSVAAVPSGESFALEVVALSASSDEAGWSNGLFPAGDCLAEVMAPDKSMAANSSSLMLLKMSSSSPTENDILNWCCGAWGRF